MKALFKIYNSWSTQEKWHNLLGGLFLGVGVYIAMVVVFALTGDVG